jgi:tetratricopeptide (TPR) repeat protein
MESDGESSTLLIDRAYEYEALGNSRKAVHDFEAALIINPGSWAAISGCAEAYLRIEAWDKAELLARKGISVLNNNSEKAPFFAVLAKSLAAQQYWKEALDAWRGALRSPRPQIDWFLGESESLAQLGRLQERVDALVKAKERNPSVVLHRSWIFAMVDAGQYDQASEEIERQISRSRWKSSWLLLRARIHEAYGRDAAKAVDAKAALEDIKSRLHSDQPDPLLLKQEAEALVLLN